MQNQQLASSNWQTIRKPLTLFLYFCLFSVVDFESCLFIQALEDFSFKRVQTVINVITGT